MGQLPQLSVVDYIVFVVLLFVCCGIGVFHAWRGRSLAKVSTKQYLLAGGHMPIWPVTLSLMASFMSAITLLGTPTEIYIYGTMYMWIIVAYFCVMAVSAHIFIPIFYRVGVTSAYEYLEMRFSRSVRSSAACILIFQMVLYLAMVLFAPCLALQAVTGLNLWGTVIVLGVACTFYTTIGGLKAVIWTDALQIVMMFAAMFAVLIKGCVLHGGLTSLWNISDNIGRIEFSNVDPSARHSIWSLTLGATVLWVTVFGVNQAQVQRALSVSSLQRAQKAIWFNFPGLTALVAICSLCGLVLTATYASCDPLLSGAISATDQFLPFFVMQYLSSIPGMAGLFVAGLFAGSLSTLSAGFNALAAVTLRDVVQSQFGVKVTDEQGAKLSRWLACLFGLLCTALTYPISLLGGLLQAGLSLFGTLGGPLLGVFALGMMVPFSNWIGAVVGLWTSTAILLWISLGYHIYKVAATVPRLARFTYGCTSTTVAQTALNFTNSTTTSPWLSSTHNITSATLESLESPELTGIFAIHKVSYLWYACIAVAIVIFVGSIISLCTGPLKLRHVDPKLLVGIFSRFYPSDSSPSEYKFTARDVSEFCPATTDRSAKDIEADGAQSALHFANEDELHSPESGLLLTLGSGYKKVSSELGDSCRALRSFK